MQYRYHAVLLLSRSATGLLALGSLPPVGTSLLIVAGATMLATAAPWIAARWGRPLLWSAGSSLWMLAATAWLQPAVLKSVYGSAFVL